MVKKLIPLKNVGGLVDLIKVAKDVLTIVANDPKVPGIKPADIEKAAPPLAEALEKVITISQPVSPVPPGQIDLGYYSKLIAVFAGSGVAFALSWLAVQIPAIAECRMIGEVTNCTLFGMFSQAQVTGGLTFLISALFVRQFPANNPPR
mgnify:CR=1 FL=1